MPGPRMEIPKDEVSVCNRISPCVVKGKRRGLLHYGILLPREGRKGALQGVNPQRTFLRSELPAHFLERGSIRYVLLILFVDINFFVNR